MCTVYQLTAKSKLAWGKSVVWLTDRLDMTTDVDWDVKPLTIQTNKNKQTNGPLHEKTCLRGFQTTQVQIRLRIRPV